MTTERALRARWIFPVAGEPIADGTVVIGEDGGIAAIHARSVDDAIDLGHVALVPGFVNAHAHLEFSDLKSPLEPAQPFTDWIRSLVGNRQARGVNRAVAIEAGLRESRAAGTVAVGEIATDDWPTPSPANAIPTVVFRELIGLGPERVEQQLAIARRFLEQPVDKKAPHAIRGISPHAPYSVHPALLGGLVHLARENRVPLTIHLAETPAEIELLRDGTGEFVSLLKRLNVWQERLLPGGLRPLNYLETLSKADRVLIAHGNYFDEEELDFVAARPNFGVVYCPRTHAYFGHKPHPWLKLIERGGLVAIGTDGRCSNPDLSVWNELQYLRHHFPACDPKLLLRLGTINGARALGLDTRIGTIELGKEARLAVIRLSATCTSDPYADLFHAQSKVVETILGSARSARLNLDADRLR